MPIRSAPDPGVPIPEETDHGLPVIHSAGSENQPPERGAPATVAAPVTDDQSLRERIRREIEGQEAYAAGSLSPAWPNMTADYHRGVAAVLRMILIAEDIAKAEGR